MKHLRKFNEAIIDYKSDSIKSFYDECIEYINSNKGRKTDFDSPNTISRDVMKKIGEKYGIEVVDYLNFYDELSDENKKTAPPPNGQPFALINPDTNKPRIVCHLYLNKDLIDRVYHMLKHENIHIIQKSRSGGKGNGEGMNPMDRKSYFSNKDEIMAFSQSISDIIMKSNPKNINDAISKLKSINLWKDIQSVVDKDVLNRYKKYIYLYLQQEFN